jgi:lipoprotein signal peptidase
MVISSIVLLAALDQGIKWLLIPKGDAPSPISFPIIEDFIYYNLRLHTGHSLSDAGILNIPLLLYIFGPFMVALCFLFMYGKAKYTGGSTNYVSVALIFAYAAMLCFYMDKALYGGSYNYIELYRVSIFDLKDVYMVIGFCAVLQSSVYGKSKEDLKNTPKGYSAIKYLASEYDSLKQRLRDRNAKAV